MASYRFDKYLDKGEVKKKAPTLKAISLSLSASSAGGRGHQKALKKAKIVMEAINLARDFVNEPPNVLNSKTYAKLIEKDARKLKRIRMKVLGKPQLQKEKMGLFLSVNAGSATVYAAFRTVAQWGVDARVSCLLGMTDNAINSQTTMPDFIVKGRSGKTVEILNTDAEGRLVLADVLSYACDQSPHSPHVVIDAATLTGAVLVSLGNQIAGLMSNNQKAGQCPSQWEFSIEILD